jgi:Zn-dependent peptidase ImmA (M78 family)
MVNVQFKYGVNNIPRISDAEVDRHAMLFLQDYNADLLKTPQPLDVEDFAEGYLKLRFHYTNLSHNGFILGRMVFNNTMIIVYDPENNRAEEEPVGENTIVIDNVLLADEHISVFRSTVMHECGHSIYHPEYYCIDYSELPLKKEEDAMHLPYTSCQARDVLGGEWLHAKKRKLKTDTDWLEHQAKYFSAASLMPQKAMRKLCKTPLLQSYCFEKHPEFENDALVVVVARTFQVSETSARIRVKQLKLGLVAPNESPLSYFASGRHNIPIDVQYC